MHKDGGLDLRLLRNVNNPQFERFICFFGASLRVGCAGITLRPSSRSHLRRRSKE